MPDEYRQLYQWLHEQFCDIAVDSLTTLEKNIALKIGVYVTQKEGELVICSPLDDEARKMTRSDA